MVPSRIPVGSPAMHGSDCSRGPSSPRRSEEAQHVQVPRIVQIRCRRGLRQRYNASTPACGGSRMNFHSKIRRSALRRTTHLRPFSRPCRKKQFGHPSTKASAREEHCSYSF
jgi:hypothetical protein